MLRILTTIACAALLVACGGASRNDGGGGSAGASGAAGSGGTTGSGGGPVGGSGGGGPRCPAQRGPAMAEISFGGSEYCVDVTEVTVANYAVYLDDIAQGYVPEQRPECGFNTNFEPAFLKWIEYKQFPANAIQGLDWCDADAFCRWAGKRLCRSVEGKSITWKDFTGTDQDFPPLSSEWAVACSAGGQFEYTYGDQPKPGVCADAVSAPSVNVPAGGLPGCHSPDPAFAAVYDLSGGMREWEDACEASTGKDDFCLVRGEARSREAKHQRCLVGEPRPRGNADFLNGVRCCADTIP